jgi:hypothetical protein
LHPSACRALARCAQQRDELLDPPHAANYPLCVSGRPPEVSTVRRVFYQLSRQTGLRGPSDRRGPRLQDFRQRCAREILLKRYQAGEDVERRLPVLSTFLGHGQGRKTSRPRRHHHSVVSVFMKLRARRRLKDISAKHSGTSQARPSSWSRRLGDWKVAGRCNRELDAHPAGLAGELLHAAFDGSTTSQPTYHRVLSGHVPFTLELCTKTVRQVAFQLEPYGSGCAFDQYVPRFFWRSNAVPQSAVAMCG